MLLLIIAVVAFIVAIWATVKTFKSGVGAFGDLFKALEGGSFSLKNLIGVSKYAVIANASWLVSVLSFIGWIILLIL